MEHVTRAREAYFSRSFPRSAKFLLQNCAILHNGLRTLIRQTPSPGNAVQSNETMRNSLGLNYKSAVYQLTYAGAAHMEAGLASSSRVRSNRIDKFLKNETGVIRL